MVQVRLERPADISAAVSLREEEQGFWSKNASSMLQVGSFSQHVVPISAGFHVFTCSFAQRGMNKQVTGSAFGLLRP